MKRTILSLSSLALLATVLVGCKGSGGENVAVVNGEAISTDEFHRYLERKPIVIVQTEQGVQELPVARDYSLGFQAMRDLINRKVLLQVAKDEGVYPTDADVKKELDFQTKRNPNFVNALKQQGLNLEEIRRDLTLDLAKERIVTKGVTVTPDEADKFIKDNPDKFLQPEQAKVRLVAVKDAKAKADVDKDLASGQPFQQVAVRYSIAPNVRQTQGLFPVSVVPQMPAVLQEFVKASSQNKTSDWKQDGANWVKFYLEQKVDAKKIPIDDSIKETVRRSLAMERGGQATDLGKRLVDKLRGSKVNVTPVALKTVWDKSFKDLQETDVQANTRTTGGASAGGAAPAGGAPAPR